MQVNSRLTGLRASLHGIEVGSELCSPTRKVYAVELPGRGQRVDEALESNFEVVFVRGVTSRRASREGPIERAGRSALAMLLSPKRPSMAETTQSS